MSPAWPWWSGGLALGALTLLTYIVLRRPLGVSGSWERVLAWRQARVAFASAQDAANEEALAAAMLEATREAMLEAGVTPPPEMQAPVVSIAKATRAARPWTADLSLLLGLLGGGALAALSRRELSWDFSLGADFAQRMGGASVWVLFLGGVCVGFGTRMAGGCTSGHGLSGCARLKPASFLATGVFFAAAVATAFLLDAVRS